MTSNVYCYMLSRSNLTGASWDEVWASSESSIAPTADRRAPKEGKRKASKKRVGGGGVVTTSSHRHPSTKQSSNSPSPHDSFACTIEDPPDPLCDLYFRGFSSSFDDIMDVYQKDSQYRNSHHDIEENSSISTTSREEEMTSPSHSKDHPQIQENNEPKYSSSKEGWTEHTQYVHNNNSQLLNIGAYLITGVLMIFILECFIKMGMAIAISNRSF